MTDSGFDPSGLWLVSLLVAHTGVRLAFGIAFRERGLNPFQGVMGAVTVGTALLLLIHGALGGFSPTNEHPDGSGLLGLLVVLLPIPLVMLIGIGLTVAGLPERRYRSYAAAAEVITVFAGYVLAFFGLFAFAGATQNHLWSVLVLPSCAFVATWSALWVTARREEAR